MVLLQRAVKCMQQGNAGCARAQDRHGSQWQHLSSRCRASSPFSAVTQHFIQPDQQNSHAGDERQDVQKAKLYVEQNHSGFGSNYQRY
ncbi:hypothetical protein [Pseudomonas brassicacearum]|uniref:hypothetical protein n=1 Tax=Pseudomonas brassicacearum TaxID=930166 RepID=UPI00161EED98|nr:hypothetical protein [Pseudomonas brassicacearum]